LALLKEHNEGRNLVESFLRQHERGNIDVRSFSSSDRAFYAKGITHYINELDEDYEKALARLKDVMLVLANAKPTVFGEPLLSAEDVKFWLVEKERANKAAKSKLMETAKISRQFFDIEQVWLAMDMKEISEAGLV
jgi:hypothetical protein